MQHESTINYQHFIQDLVDMYPFSMEEAIIVELIANSLDAKSSVIEIKTSKEELFFEIKDNGRGMKEEEFKNYHNFSMTFKEKGKGIGFAGLGAKLALKIGGNIVTETIASKFKGASDWCFKGKKPLWQDKPVDFLKGKGTLVRIYLNQKNSILLQPDEIKKIIIKHYLPVLLFADFYKQAEVYPEGLKFIVNQEMVVPPVFEDERASPFLFLTRGKKRKPFGVCRFTLTKSPLVDEFQGIGVSTFGKVINTEQREWFKQQPKTPERISGIIEVPELVTCLTTTKTAFHKEGSYGAKYYNFYRSSQEQFIKWLDQIGQRDRKVEIEKDIELTKELSKIIGKIITDIPQLSELFRAKPVGQTNPQGTETGTPPTTVAVPPSETSGDGEGGGEIDKEPKPLVEIKPDGKGPVEPTRRSIKFGPSISYANEPEKEEISWTEGLGNIFINKAHPTFMLAEKSDFVLYHRVLAIGLALIRELPEDQDKLTILNQYLTNWGKI
ncbi:MAG: ATP-binding protein [Planctomycetota bacterium]|nr:ATP-binding protein [Planctomycetota bacterium]